MASRVVKINTYIDKFKDHISSNISQISTCELFRKVDYSITKKFQINLRPGRAAVYIEILDTVYDDYSDEINRLYAEYTIGVYVFAHNDRSKALSTLGEEVKDDIIKHLFTQDFDLPIELPKIKKTGFLESPADQTVNHSITYLVFTQRLNTLELKQ